MIAAERVQKVIMGVIAQALRDAGADHVVISGTGANAELLRTWCARGLGTIGVAALGLELHPASKTALLLGDVPHAAVLPFGDLYSSQLAELGGGAESSEHVAPLIRDCGGISTLDGVLERYYDRRMSWPEAAAALTDTARERLRDALDAARFRRMHVGLIPKLGARTLGIDLYA